MANMTTERIWIEDRNWRLLGKDSVSHCRMKGCHELAVAEVARHHSRAIAGFTWWAYCSEHLYGRHIVDGKVEVAVVPDSPFGQRGYV